MSGTLQDVINNIQDTVGALTGIGAAPDYPPSSIVHNVTAITYAAGGRFTTVSAGWLKGLHTVHVDLMVPAVNLENDIATLNPYLSTIPNAIAKTPTFGGNADTFGDISYTMITVSYAGKEYRGYRFIITDIKIQPAIT